MESNILLESGTNELEVLEFMVGTQSFGINIAKVTEIMNYQPMVPVPDSHPAFEGVFTPRDKVISVINLHTILHKESPDPEHDLLIICHFNGKDVGFHVSSVRVFSAFPGRTLRSRRQWQVMEHTTSLPVSLSSRTESYLYSTLRR